jgi:hypothetical protein
MPWNLVNIEIFRNVSPVAVLHVPDELELLQGDVEVGVLELGGQLVLLKLLKPIFLQFTPYHVVGVSFS